MYLPTPDPRPISQLQAPSEHPLSWSCHVHMVVCFPPFNVQLSTWQIHPASSTMHSQDASAGGMLLQEGHRQQ